MKHIFLFFLLFPCVVFSQYMMRDYSLDSLAFANTQKILHLGGKSHDGVLELRPYDWVKFSFKTRINGGVFSGGILDDEFDVVSLGVYDVRMKIYLTQDVRFLTKLIINGSPQGVVFNKFLSYGFILKF